MGEACDLKLRIAFYAYDGKTNILFYLKEPKNISNMFQFREKSGFLRLLKLASRPKLFQSLKDTISRWDRV